MTSLSTILGIVPIALALGAGSESRKSMGIAVIGGLIVGSLFTLYVIPAMYSFLASRVVRSKAQERVDELTADEGRGVRRPGPELAPVARESM